MSIAIDLAASLDPVVFVNKCGLDPDPWQADVLRSTSGRLILCCARQTGKSTIAALKALHEATFKPGSLILLLSPTLRQSSELFRRVSGFYSALGNEAPPADTETLLRLELANGSRILSLPGQTEGTVRGFSGASLLIFDEAARCSDQLWAAARPMLATSAGAIILLSTPAGKRGFFHGVWTQGVGWERVRVTAYECPRISRVWLEEEKATLGPHIFAEEYLCEFRDPSWQVWPTEYLDALFSDEAVIEWDI